MGLTLLVDRSIIDIETKKPKSNANNNWTRERLSR